MDILLSILAVLFIGLKLTGYITWSWWLVLSPVLVPAAIALTLALMALVAVLYEGVKTERAYRKRNGL